MKIKKRLFPLILFFIVTLIVLGIVIKVDRDKAQLADTAYIYPVLPGTEEWNDLGPEGRRKSCYLSASDVEYMTTRALVETVVTYPFIVDINANGNWQDPIHPKWNGVKLVAEEQFPPLAVLMQRPDAVIALREYEAAAKAELGEDYSAVRYAKQLGDIFEAVLAAGDPEGRLAASKTE